MLSLCALGILLLMSCGSEIRAQNSASGPALERQIVTKQFIFMATSVTPMRGQTRFLDPTYDVRLKKDSVLSYLPYFGVAQTAPLPNENSGISFTSTNFDYSYISKKKGSWDVQVNFKDQTATREFHFLIYDNGNASLDVISNNRDPISFKGYIKLQ